MDPRDELVIGRLGRPHGVHGALRARSYSGELDHFRKLRRVVLLRNQERSEFEVLSVAVHGSTPVLRLDGIETPEAARSLTGCEIVVPRRAAARLDNGEYYVVDLVGLAVLANGEICGTVTAVIEAAQAPLLEIEPARESGRPALVPFMDRYVGSVDLTAGSLEVREPWILDFE